MSASRTRCIFMLLLPAVLSGPVPMSAADEYVGSQFTDGAVYSEVLVEDHLTAIPFPNVHSPLARGSTDSWLLRWNITGLKTNRSNYPDQVNYLTHQGRTGLMAYGFRAGGYSSAAVCNTAKAVELYSIAPNGPAQMLKSLPADDPATSRPPVRLFTRSGEYLFLWNPTPAIYAVSNLTVVKQIRVTENFKSFTADLQREGGWQESLTDDLKYLIHVPLEFGRPFNQNTIVDSPRCYNLETGEYAKWQIHAGTNRTVIVSAESVSGSLVFIAFYEASGSKHLGILDRDSQLMAELPTAGTRDTQFERNCSWDYAHSRFLVRQPGGKLTIYDYRTKQAHHFLLAHPNLLVP